MDKMNGITTEKHQSEHSHLLSALQNALKTYLSEKKNLTLNALSKRCTVSEPTLRRIFKGQVKTLPNSTTVLDILMAITGEKNASAIAQKYPGAIASYINSVLPQVVDCATEYDSDLNQTLQNTNKYILFKLASNSVGVSINKITELFGANGIGSAEDLLDQGYLVKSKNTYFTKIRNFTSSKNDFVKKFQAVAEFIKTKSSMVDINLNPLLANYSESVSPEAYREIISIQQKALLKIRTVMSADSSQGQIPLFLLLAIDTLDSKCAYEIAKPQDTAH